MLTNLLLPPPPYNPVGVHLRPAVSVEVQERRVRDAPEGARLFLELRPEEMGTVVVAVRTGGLRPPPRDPVRGGHLLVLSREVGARDHLVQLVAAVPRRTRWGPVGRLGGGQGGRGGATGTPEILLQHLHDDGQLLQAFTGLLPLEERRAMKTWRGQNRRARPPPLTGGARRDARVVTRFLSTGDGSSGQFTAEEIKVYGIAREKVTIRKRSCVH